MKNYNESFKSKVYDYWPNNFETYFISIAIATIILIYILKIFYDKFIYPIKQFLKIKNDSGCFLKECFLKYLHREKKLKNEFEAILF